MGDVRVEGLVEEGQTDTGQQSQVDEQTGTGQQMGSEETDNGRQAGTGQQLSPDLILRITVICLGVVIVLIALLGLTSTNPFVAIVALIIGATLAVLGLFYARVTNLGGSSAPRAKRSNPKEELARQVINDPKFLRLVVRQLHLSYTDVMKAVAEQPSEVKTQILDMLNEERRKNER